MPKEPFENTELHEISFWQDLIKSEDWKYFKNILDTHKEHLNKQVVLLVRSKKHEDASYFAARAEECEKILQLVEGRLAELKTAKSEGEENGKR